MPEMVSQSARPVNQPPSFRYIVGGKLTFRRCTLEGVTFANVDADRVVFEDCTLNGTNPPAK